MKKLFQQEKFLYKKSYYSIEQISFLIFALLLFIGIGGCLLGINPGVYLFKKALLFNVMKYVPGPLSGAFRVCLCFSVFLFVENSMMPEGAPSPSGSLPTSGEFWAEAPSPGWIDQPGPSEGEQAAAPDPDGVVPDIPVLEPLLHDELRKTQLFNRLSPHILTNLNLTQNEMVEIVNQQTGKN